MVDYDVLDATPKTLVRVVDAMLRTGGRILQCDSKRTLVMILAIVHGVRFCEGLPLSYLNNGMMLKWMKRLREIDDG